MLSAGCAWGRWGLSVTFAKVFKGRLPLKLSWKEHVHLVSLRHFSRVLPAALRFPAEAVPWQSVETLSQVRLFV